MKQIYLMLSPTVQEKMAQYKEPILRYVGNALNIAIPPYSRLSHECLESDELRFATVDKLPSRTWHEYLATAMNCIDRCDRAVRVDVGAWQPHSVADDILEKYCKLIDMRVDGVLIDAADWVAITGNRSPHFIYSQLPDADVYSDKSEN